MTTLGRPAGFALACVLTGGLAFDGGGFVPASVDRALVGLATLALLLVVVAGGERPGRLAVALLAGLGLLTAWTAASWLWSDSPPRALEEAQRVALYFAAAAAVVLAGRRVPLAWLAGGIVAGASAAVLWNLALRLAPDWTERAALRSDIGQLADPVGYANGMALLAALAFVLALGLDGGAAVLLVPLAAVIALQQSSGVMAALGVGLIGYALLTRRPLRALALVVLPAAGAAVVSRATVVVDPPPTDLLAAAHTGHRLLLVLALLALAQAALALGLPQLPSGAAVPRRVAAAAAVATVVCMLIAVPVALRGNERGHYWGVAAHEVRANPVLGSGAGTFVDWWLRNRTVPQSTQEAHSLYLETLAELGPVGLALLLVALGTPLVAAWRMRDNRWGATLLGALVVFDIAVAVDFHWELAGVTVPAILLGAAAVSRADEPRGALRARYAVPALAALVAAGVLALIGNAALAAGDTQRAVRFAPYSPDAWKLLGESRRAHGDAAGALAAYRQAAKLDPNDWSTWVDLAQLLNGEPRRSALARAARLNPFGGIR